MTATGSVVTCRHCQVAITADPVTGAAPSVCPACGADLGDQLPAPAPGRPPHRAGILLLLTIIAFLLVMALLTLMTTQLRAIHAEMTGLRADLARLPDAVAAAQVAMAPAPVAQNDVADAGPAQSSPADTQTAPQLTPAQMAELEQRQRETVSEDLNKQYPLNQPGDRVALRLLSGRVERGVFLAVQDGLVALRQEDKGIMEIPAAQLDRPSRLRVDRAFRLQVLEYSVRQRMKTLDVQ